MTSPSLSRPRVGFVGGGASYHELTATDPLWVDRLTPLYLPEITAESLIGLDALVLADHLHPAVLARQAAVLLTVLDRGGTLVVLGENHVHEWLDGVGWEPRQTNFWWWREAQDSHLRGRSPDHPIWAAATPDDFIWHFHGVLTPPPGTTPLLVLEEGDRERVVLYEDTTSSRGRLLVTTLDPVYHHGSNFMPTATRCLAALIAWLDQSALPLDGAHP